MAHASHLLLLAVVVALALTAPCARAEAQPREASRMQARDQGGPAPEPIVDNFMYQGMLLEYGIPLLEMVAGLDASVSGDAVDARQPDGADAAGYADEPDAAAVLYEHFYYDATAAAQGAAAADSGCTGSRCSGPAGSSSGMGGGASQAFSSMQQRRLQQQNASQDLPDVCSLPAVTGPCRASIPRWAYNATTQTCQEFIYGGCQGNANNFESEEQCKAACGGRDPAAAPPAATDSSGAGSGGDARAAIIAANQVALAEPVGIQAPASNTSAAAPAPAPSAAAAPGPAASPGGQQQQQQGARGSAPPPAAARVQDSSAGGRIGGLHAHTWAQLLLLGAVAVASI